MQALLYVLLTVAPELPDPARAALIAEATRVWETAGIHLNWRAGSDDGQPPGSSLRVLVIPRARPGPDPGQGEVLGELVNVGRAGAVAIVSIDRAQRIVAARSGAGGVPPSWHHHQLGLVLGRVAAHEIGHHVLNTRTHARTGLMRATFEVHELIDRRSNAFEVDGEVLTRLRTLGPSGPFALSNRLSGG